MIRRSQEKCYISNDRFCARWWEKEFWFPEFKKIVLKGRVEHDAWVKNVVSKIRKKNEEERAKRERERMEKRRKFIKLRREQEGPFGTFVRRLKLFFRFLW